MSSDVALHMHVLLGICIVVDAERCKVDNNEVHGALLAKASGVAMRVDLIVVGGDQTTMLFLVLCLRNHKDVKLEKAGELP
ncbi:hypothetical protein BHE74_00036812 [Ensete ventricosum]|nr:hypothetical protein BHE74_00036812 [Ensete ventricosum]